MDIPETFNSKLRSDGVYVQFGMGNMKGSGDSDVTPCTWYNMMMITSKLYEKDTMFTFGRLMDVFYDKDNPEKYLVSSKRRNQTCDCKNYEDIPHVIPEDSDDQYDGDESVCKHQYLEKQVCFHGDEECECCIPSNWFVEFIKKERYGEGVIRDISNPLSTATDVANLSIKELENMSYGQTCAFWDLTSPSKHDPDDDMDRSKYENLGWAQLCGVNDDVHIICYNNDPSIVYLPYYTYDSEYNANFPYIFVPNDRTEDGPWRKYYESWKIFNTRFCDYCGVCLSLDNELKVTETIDGVDMLSCKDESSDEDEESNEDEESSNYEIPIIEMVCKWCKICLDIDKVATEKSLK